MKALKALVIAAAAVAATMGASDAKEWKKVRIAVEGVYPPFNYMENGKLTGFDVEIGKAMCDKMKVDCEWITQEWDGMIPGLLAGKYDAIVASMRVTEERKKKVDFSDKYYATPAHFMAQKDSKVTDTSPAALAGKTVGVQGSTVQASFLEKNYPNTTVKAYQTVDDASADLAAGRVDLVLSDKVLLNAWLGKSSDAACCELVGPDLSDPKDWGPGMAVATRKEDSDLNGMFNKAIKEIRADGSYQKINDKYFPFSVY
ncbi:amino acid ABC transporter (plasmid) [Mesorhizobium loti NZP2037]|nr:transporter substrate-binding domain-containing protein [Mesorhizobium loti]ANN61898.1 amino acid ABC transporter [Mesorhizobium loti NZP2037]